MEVEVIDLTGDDDEDDCFQDEELFDQVTQKCSTLWNNSQEKEMDNDEELTQVIGDDDYEDAFPSGDMDDAEFLLLTQELETSIAAEGKSRANGGNWSDSSSNTIWTTATAITQPLMFSFTNTGTVRSVNIRRSTPSTPLEIGRFRGDLVNSATTGEFDQIFSQSFDVLHNTFRLDRFRPIQMQAVNASILNQDCFVLMPTGGGKSLCYQLPAVLSPGVTVVVSPLISLILDQIRHLRSMRIPAAHLCGNISNFDQDRVIKDLQSGNPAVKILYVTPEKLVKSDILRSALKKVYESQKLSAFAIDEAHCVSYWGHDFRVDYKKLESLKKNYPGVRIMAFTATATPRVRNDVERILGLHNTKWFLSSFNRPNLKYEVRRVSKKLAYRALKDILRSPEFIDKCGIVYCLARNDCDELAHSLNSEGFKTASYHAGLDYQTRKSAQERWTNDEINFVCSTIAFGMGIDKPDVRYVINYSLPMSIEGYYQQSGRAGRDCLPATCIIFYDYEDITRNQMLIQRTLGEKKQKKAELKRVAQENLQRMAMFCENNYECRRVLQLDYFGEIFDRERCKADLLTACDNCKRPSELVDVTHVGIHLLQAAKVKLDQSRGWGGGIKFTDLAQYYFNCVKLPREVVNGLQLNLDHLDVVMLMRLMLCDGYLTEEFIVIDGTKGQEQGYSSIAIGPNAHVLESGWEVLEMGVSHRKIVRVGANSNSNPRGRIRPTPGRREGVILSLEEGCYHDLKAKWKMLTEYVGISSDGTMDLWVLREIALKLPRTAAEMMSVPGVTAANYREYGEHLLEITIRYSRERSNV